MTNAHRPSFLPLLIRTLAAVAVLAILLVVIALAVPPATVDQLLTESGAIERASAIAWIALAAYCVILFKKTPATFAGAALALAAAARELDWHKHFTGDSVLKLTFYIPGDHPLVAQLIAGAIVALIVISLGVVTWRFFRNANRDPRLLPPWAAVSIAALVLMGATKLLDRVPGILKDDFGVPVPDRAFDVTRMLEEGLELALPFLFALAMHSFKQERYGQQNI